MWCGILSLGSMGGLVLHSFGDVASKQSVSSKGVEGVYFLWWWDAWAWFYLLGCIPALELRWWIPGVHWSTLECNIPLDLRHCAPMFSCVFRFSLSWFHSLGCVLGRRVIFPLLVASKLDLCHALCYSWSVCVGCCPQGVLHHFVCVSLSGLPLRIDDYQNICRLPFWFSQCIPEPNCVPVDIFTCVDLLMYIFSL